MNVSGTANRYPLPHIMARAQSASRGGAADTTPEPRVPGPLAGGSLTALAANLQMLGHASQDDIDRTAALFLSMNERPDGPPDNASRAMSRQALLGRLNHGPSFTTQRGARSSKSIEHVASRIGCQADPVAAGPTGYLVQDELRCEVGRHQVE